MKKVKIYQLVSPQVIQGYSKYIASSMFLPRFLNNSYTSFNIFDDGHINYRDHYAFTKLQRTAILTEQQAREVIVKFIADYRKNIQQFIEWKKVDENFPFLFHRFLKQISATQVFTPFWLIN